MESTGFHNRRVHKPSVLFCSAFNKGSCALQGPHPATLRGRVVQVSHICAACLIKNHTQVNHAEIDKACPIQAFNVNGIRSQLEHTVLNRAFVPQGN